MDPCSYCLNKMLAQQQTTERVFIGAHLPVLNHPLFAVTCTRSCHPSLHELQCLKSRVPWDALVYPCVTDKICFISIWSKFHANHDNVIVIIWILKKAMIIKFHSLNKSRVIIKTISRIQQATFQSRQILWFKVYQYLKKSNDYIYFFVALQTKKFYAHKIFK